ncbi:hypothetical protein Tco_0836728 [Tanacetum coccineum]
MRCKKHYTDLSSTIGVCSCCLRERLIHLIAIQEQQNQTLETLKHHNSVKIQPPTSRKSDYSDLPRHHHHSHSDQLFYTTPQVAATSTAPKKRSSFKRFLTFQNIFRSKHKNEDDATSSWISSILHRRKKTVHVDVSVVTAPVTRRYCRDRGMSPARNSDEEGGVCDELTTESWKNTPRRTPANNNGKRGHVRNGSGLTFCVSPYLVRPSPNRDANLMNTKSFCANRSRKLADFGRPSLNR